VPQKRPPDKGRAAYFTNKLGGAELEAAAPDEAEQHENQYDDENDPQQAHFCSFRLSGATTTMCP